MSTNVLINPQVPSDEQQKVDAIFSGIEEHMGFVPDGLKLYSVSPTLLENFVANVGYFMSHPELSQELLAMIRYLVSSDAGCSFCIDFNAGLLINKLGKTAEQLQAAQENIDDAPLQASEIVLLKIALAAISNPEGVTAEDMKKVRDHGFSDRNIFDAVAIAANNKAFTHVLRTFKVEHQGSFA